MTLLEIFEEKTQYNLEKFLRDVHSFIRKHYPRIIQFYSVKGSQYSFNIKDSILILEDLLSECETILSILQNHSDTLPTSFWEIIELIDDTKLNLEFIQNTPKWLRSVLSKGSYTSSFEEIVMLKQNETLESLSKKVGSDDKDNDWVKIALRNDLSEEEYSSEGGVQLVLQYFNKLDITIQSVVDCNIVGEKIYGKDCSRFIEFVDNDLHILTYRETLLQTVSILCNLRQGDNPEFIEDGLQSSLVIGSNRNSIPYQIIARQLLYTFQKDDSFKSFLLKDIKTVEDSLEIDLQVETRIDEAVPQKITL